jgi:hypothetical protein
MFFIFIFLMASRASTVGPEPPSVHTFAN